MSNDTKPTKYNWYGAYDNAYPYIVNDAVSYNGKSYICILASTGHLPTNATYWVEGGYSYDTEPSVGSYSNDTKP